MPSTNQHRSFAMNGTFDANASDRYFDRLPSQNATLADSSIYAKLDPNIIKQKTSRLHDFFLEIAQGRTNEAEVFDTVHNMIQACTDIFDDIIRSGGLTSDGHLFEWLNQERNTWKLLFCLYKDRLLNQPSMEDGNDDDFFMNASEKEIIEKLYKENENLREYQLIVDWLEQCETQRFDKFGHFMDETVSWENTLHQLQNIDRTAFSGKKNIVKSLDPDAPHREKLPLHDLDAEDEARISKEVNKNAIECHQVSVSFNECPLLLTVSNRYCSKFDKDIWMKLVVYANESVNGGAQRFSKAGGCIMTPTIKPKLHHWKKYEIHIYFYFFQTVLVFIVSENVIVFPFFSIQLKAIRAETFGKNWPGKWPKIAI